MMPREKLLLDGPESLSDVELLAIFLRTGVRGVPVLELSDRLLMRYSGLRGLILADPEDFMKQPGIGKAKFAQLKSGLEMSRRYLKAGLERGITVSDPGVTREFLMMKMRDYYREVFVCLFLDNQH